MSKFTTPDLDEMPVRIRPFDNHGHFVPMDCPHCGNGTLKYERNGLWRCDGLADPGHDNKPLEACEFVHVDGEPYSTTP